MIPDFKKSIDNILHDRLSSPFFGAFLFSWCVWNWKVIYLTLFINDSKIQGTKIDFIVKNYSDSQHLIWHPLLSTLFLILIYPLIATGAFWVSLKFENIKNNIKNSEEKKQLLSIEKSIELREELRNQDEKFDKLLTKKNEEILILKQELELYRNKIDSTISVLSSGTEISPEMYSSDYESMKNNNKLFEEFKKIAPRAQKQMTMFYEGNIIDRKLFDFFLANEIIEKISNSNSPSTVYGLTEKGRYFNKKLINETLIS